MRLQVIQVGRKMRPAQGIKISKSLLFYLQRENERRLCPHVFLYDQPQFWVPPRTELKRKIFSLTGKNLIKQYWNGPLTVGNLAFK